MGKELHLFIIWQNGRCCQDRILADIRKRFAIYRMFDIQWTKNRVSSNFTRFYGTHLPLGCDKVQECGDGRFLLVVVQDNQPVYDYRPTSRGKEIVNTNTFDAKQLYRSWVGGGSQIHGTNNTIETNHNLTLLLGCNLEDFQKQYQPSDEIEELTRDLEGANGWNSVQHLLYVLNNIGAEYAVMRGAEDLFDESFSEEHRDIDVLVSKYNDVKYIINGEACCNPCRPHFKLTISGYEYYFDLWDIDRGYYDMLWIKEMLATRKQYRDVYVLNDQNHFYCLLYHCLIHKGGISAEYMPYLEKYKTGLPQVDSAESWDEILLRFLKKHSYDITKPDDLSIDVYLNKEEFQKYALRFGKFRKQTFTHINDEMYYAKVYEREQSFVKKGSAYLVENEAKFLRALEEYDYFPKCIKKYTEEGDIHCLEISRMRGADWGEFFSNKKNITLRNIQSAVRQLQDILRILKERHIVHRDIQPSNIFVEKAGADIHLGLIDFAWSCYEEEMKDCPTPFLLGGVYKRYEGFDDAYSVSVLISTTWPHIPFVKKIANELKKGNIIEASSVKISMRDYAKVYLLRHRYIAKQIKRIKRKIKSLRIYKLVKRK